MLAASTTTLFRATGLAAVATRSSLQPASAKALLQQASAATPAAPLSVAAFCPYAAARPRMLSTRTSAMTPAAAATTTTTTTTTGLSPKRRGSRPQLSSKRVLFSPFPPSSARLASSSSTQPQPQQRSPARQGPGATQTGDAAVDAAAAATVSRAQTAAHADLPPLDWNTFFTLRKTRRRIQLTFSVVGGLTGGLVGGLFLGSGVAEPLLSQVPLDPFLTLGLMTFGFATLGWLAGPSIGNVVFYAWKRQYREQMTLKETQFFARIKKNRVDPSASSASNPVPDFYGEKISSVAGYRQWLKDQRAFSKKRTTFV